MSNSDAGGSTVALTADPEGDLRRALTRILDRTA
jgi:hypothetical protein